MKKRDEEARANMKGKMVNCLVVAVVLLSVSALSGAVICVQGDGHPPGPEPNKIEVISVVPSSITADGASEAIITARAMKDDVPSNNHTLTFKIMLEPREGNVYLSTTDPVYNYGKMVGNVTNDDGYAYARLKAGEVAGDVKIEVYRGNVSDTVVVTLEKVQPPENKTNFTLEFITGYNMISLPVNDSAVTDAASFAAKIGDNCTGIIKWDSAIQEYVTYLPGVPLKNFDVSGGEGYLANINKPMSATFTGESWESPFTVSMVTGYNMISLPVNDSAVTDAASFAAKIGDNCTGIIKWDSAIQEYVTYLPGVPLKNFDVSVGEGYLANVNHPTDVTFN